MSLLNASHNPPHTISPEGTVHEACEKMKTHNVGAVAVISPDERPIGMLTERDIVQKVVLGGLDPKSTKVRDVMMSPCLVIPMDRSVHDALSVLLGKTAFHVGVIDENQKLVGVVSYRTLLRAHIENLNAEVDHLAAYMGSDGIGGD